MARNNKLSKGSLLIEVSIALTLLISLGLILLQYIFNVIQLSNWSVIQTLSESALTYEVAYMERIPLQDALGADSPYPFTPFFNTSTVTMGSLKSGVPVQATLIRTRRRISNSTDTMSLRRFRFYTVLKYQVNGKNYYKTRSVIRTG